jgi:hypothetical protein
MPVNPQQLPFNVTSGDAMTGANARATQQIFMSTPRFSLLELEDQYMEPMILNVGAEQPVGIELLRITNQLAPEVPVLCGSMVHWTYRPDLGGAQIMSIDGLSPLSGVRYLFVFRITYRAQV